MHARIQARARTHVLEHAHYCEHTRVTLHNHIDESLSVVSRLHFLLRGRRALAVHKKRAELMQLSELFHAEIVDVGVEHVTIMLTAWPKRIDALIELAKP